MSNKTVNIRNSNLQKRTNAAENSKPHNKKKNNDIMYDENKTNYFLIPIFIILCIIPFITKLKVYDPNMAQFQWFPETDQQGDFFLYYKQWAFVVMTGIITLLVILKVIIDKKKTRFSFIFIPLAVYALLALLSAIFSKYASFSFSGSFEMFESIFVLIGYCIVVYYVYLYIDSENDFKKIYKYIIGVVFIMSLLGVFQYLGYDFFGSQLGKNIIIPTEYRNIYNASFEFEASRVYLTLYNPNYVGVYVALIVPIITVMLFFQNKIIAIILSILAITGLVICAYGAVSLTGVIGILIISIFFIPIFMWRYMLKRLYLTIPLTILLVLGIIILNKYSNQSLFEKLKSEVFNAKAENALSDMHTEDNCVSLTYNGNIMKVQSVLSEDQTITLIAYDQDNQTVSSLYDPVAANYAIADKRFPGFVLGWDKSTAGIFYIQIDGVVYRFTNLTGDNIYYYVNQYNKLDKMIKAPSMLFTGYERFASGRGYIWSRTLPLLKKYVFLGSGPDTFTMAFPQQDYLGLLQNGYSTSIMTKPHNMFLQMAVQTGDISLIALLLFYLLYSISSIRLYIRGRFTSYYAKIGVAIFIATLSYMFTGLTNDSNINTAPIFWVLIGVGIAANSKAKPLIREEIAAIKIKKLEERQARKNNLDIIK